MITFKELRQLLEGWGSYYSRHHGVTDRAGTGKIKPGITVHSGGHRGGYSSGGGRHGKLVIYQTISQKSGQEQRRTRQSIKVGAPPSKKIKLFKTPKTLKKAKH